MYQQNTILSDAVERAAMAGGIYPAESRAEAAVKRGLAKALTYAARWLDPAAYKGQDGTLGPASQASS